MKILELWAKLGLKNDGFKAGMKEAKKVANDTAKDIAKDFKGALAGYFGYQALKTLIVNVADHAVEIKHLSKQYNVTTDEVQRLDKVARHAGESFEDFGSMLNRMSGARKQAVEENRELRDTFAKYGVTLADLNNPQLRNIDLMKKMSLALKGMKLTEQDREAFREIFGRSAPKLLEALKEFDEKKPMSLISQAQIDRIEEAQKKIKELHREYEKGMTPSIAAGAEHLVGGLGFLSGPKSEVNAGDKSNWWANAARIALMGPAGFFRLTAPQGPDTTAPGERNFIGPTLAPKPGDKNFIGPVEGESERLYRDKIAIGDKNAADKAELALQNAILETEVKRGGEAAKRAQIQKEITYNLDQAASMEKLHAGKLTDIDREFIAEHRTEAQKLKQELQAMKPGGQIEADAMTKRGQLTGGALNRAMLSPGPNQDAKRVEKLLMEIVATEKRLLEEAMAEDRRNYIKF